MVHAFIVYVRLILECTSTIWSPYLVKDIKLVESVQKRFTKRLPNTNHISHADRLRLLGLETLELQRLQADQIYAYKIIFSKAETDLFIKSSSSTTRGHSYKAFMFIVVATRVKIL